MISVVVPIYNEEETIVALHTAMQKAMNASGEAWEVIYVNDGSRDQSMPLLLQQQALDAHVVVVELSRNWGHQGAITAGLSVAKGNAVVTMDGDLQDHPSVIPQMIDCWKSGAQVVLAERRSRLDSGLKAVCYPLFYKMLGRLADYPIPMNSGIFGLIDRKVADQINAMPERNRYIPGLKTFVGFRTETIYYDRLVRHAGEPKYTWKKLIKYACDAVYSFSYKPLRLALFSGSSLLAFTIVAGMVLLGAGLSGAIRGQLWFDCALALTAIFFVSGLQLTCMGFMGEYIGRIYDEVRERPLFVIDHVRRASEASLPYNVPKLRPTDVAQPAFAPARVTAVHSNGNAVHNGNEPSATVVIPLPSAA
jgi:polyisoprenyl-phosphate glycosyltransferase